MTEPEDMYLEFLQFQKLPPDLAGPKPVLDPVAPDQITSDPSLYHGVGAPALGVTLPDPVPGEPVAEEKGLLGDIGDGIRETIATVQDAPNALSRGAARGILEAVWGAGILDDKQMEHFRGLLDLFSQMAADEGVNETASGMLEGVGQIAPVALPVFKVLKVAGMGRAAAAVIAEGLGGAFAFNPDDPNLANMAQEFMSPQPGGQLFKALEIMATNPDDPAWQNRARNAIQDSALGLAFEALLKIPGAARAMVERFREGKSPVPMGMSIEDVSRDGPLGPAAAGDPVASGEVLGEAAPDAVPGQINIDQVEQGAIPVPQPNGIPFAPEITQKNVRLHTQRLAKVAEGKAYPGAPQNERTVIPAPEGSDLPDFVVGAVTKDDWIARTEHMLSPEEIKEAALWYDEAFGQFLKRTNGDEEQSSKLMGAWLAASQNESPASAMTNVLFMQEQLNRGVPVDQVKGKGLPTANSAALSVLRGDVIEGGVGQKIADFIDSGNRRDTRSIMGDDPAGGAPFVVDIHTARDTGFVDQKLKNHLNRLGYDVPDSVISDLSTGGINGTKYENRGVFGRELTDHLNQIGWQGKSDLKPREIQAIGWMSVTKVYSTANQSGDIAGAFGRNTRRISLEAAPGQGSPADIKYGKRFQALPEDSQRSVTFEVTQRAIDKANEITGLNIGNVVHATGGWQRFTNPSTVQQAISSKEGAIQAANVLGYLLQQDEVWVNSTKALTKAPKGYAIDLIEKGSSNIADDAVLADLWNAVLEADAGDLIQGYQPIKDVEGNIGIRILVDKGGKKARQGIEEWHGAFGDIVGRLEYDMDVKISEAEIHKAVNDWKESPDGQAFTDSMDHAGPGSASDRRRSVSAGDRQELEDLFGTLIEASEGGGS